MTQPIHIIYLPGFGGKYDNARLKILRWWRFRNVTVEMIPLRWEQGTFEQKIAAIDRAIDRAAGKRIVLLGESAGGSMAVHMYARRPDDLHRVMTLCGKNSHPETVSQQLLDYSAAFKTSMEKLPQSGAELTREQKANFVSIHPLYDTVVPVHETTLPGCKQVRLWAVGHFIVIFLALTILSPISVRAARRR